MYGRLIPKKIKVPVACETISRAKSYGFSGHFNCAPRLVLKLNFENEITDGVVAAAAVDSITRDSERNDLRGHGPHDVIKRPFNASVIQRTPLSTDAHPSFTSAENNERGGEKRV